MRISLLLLVFLVPTMSYAYDKDEEEIGFAEYETKSLKATEKIYQSDIPLFMKLSEASRNYQPHKYLKETCQEIEISSWHEDILFPIEEAIILNCDVIQQINNTLSSIKRHKKNRDDFFEVQEKYKSKGESEYTKLIHYYLTSAFNVYKKTESTTKNLHSALKSMESAGYSSLLDFQDEHLGSKPYTLAERKAIERLNKEGTLDFDVEVDVYLAFASYCLRDNFEQYFKISLDKGRLKEVDLSLVPKDDNGNVMKMGDFEQNRYFLTPNSKQLYIGVAEIAKTSYCYVASPHIQPITLHWLATTYLKQRNVLHSLMKSGVTGHRVDVDTKRKATNNTIAYNAHFNWKKDGIATFPITAYFAKGIAANQPKQLGVIYYKEKH